MSYTTFLFDLDDTLCHADQRGEEIYVGAFEVAGVDPVGRPADLWAALDGPPAVEDVESYLAAGFAAVLADHDADADPYDLAAGFTEVVDHGAVSFRPGAESVLEHAREAGRVGLLTNGPEHRQAVKLESLGLTDAFDAVVYAGDMPNRKPHRDPFDRTLALLGTNPRDALYVGDSLEYDVAGAQGAGIDAAWCPVGRNRRPAVAPDPGDLAPEYTLLRLADLHPVIDGEA
jgi:putative hydrolase of the HAD superfamily